MENNVFSYLDKDYRYLNNYIRDFEKALFTSPHSAIIKGRTFAEKITQEISNQEGYGLLNMITQSERLKKLENEGVIDGEIDELLHTIRKLGNKAAHADIEAELEVALIIHKCIYKITCWFVENYIDYKFEAGQYRNPMPERKDESNINQDMLSGLIRKAFVENIPVLSSVIDKIRGSENNEKIVLTQKDCNSNDKSDVKSTNYINENLQFHKENELDKKNVEYKIDYDEGYCELNKKCLIQELSKLKESSKEAVENLGEFSDFKKYMHIERDVQKELQDLIFKANDMKTSQLILVCGSVGDGKSHIISYFNNNYPDIMKNFILHNDATESLEPTKTSMDTLNDVLDDFSDEKIGKSNSKLILAINLGTLNNFIDSKYGVRFSNLKEYVKNKKILETNIDNSDFDEKSLFQFINFSDYHMFTLKDGKVYSEYIEAIIDKITGANEYNIFYNAYKNYCSKCSNSNCCPIKSNYELIGNSTVQHSIIELLVQCIIKNKIIISTRALLNFIYEIIVPIAYIDVNSPVFKKDIYRLNDLNYIKSLMPNIIFNHKELSFIFESLNTLDPLNIRNQSIDDFIIKFNNSKDIIPYFNEYIDYPKNYIDNIIVNFEKTEDIKIRHELLKLFIRSYYLCGTENLMNLQDKVYETYIEALYYWNKGDKMKLKHIYDDVEAGIMQWNGKSEENQVNIFTGKNQIKYKVSEILKLEPDTSNLPNSDEIDIKKFIPILKLRYKSKEAAKAYEIEVDFSLYKLLTEIINGYRPNKKDKNKFIKFVEFINKLEQTGSQNKELIFIEKNMNINKKYKLEYDSAFNIYKFTEIKI